MANALGRMLYRAITLECVHDFSQLNKLQQEEVIGRVMAIGLVALGITVAMGMIAGMAIWAIPLSVLLSMGSTFVLTTDPQHLVSPSIFGRMVQDMKK